MRVGVTLAAEAALLLFLAPFPLRRMRWPERAPGLGILAWQALSLAALIAAVLAGVALAAPTDLLAHGLSGLWQICVHTFTAGFGEADPGRVVGLVGLSVAGLLAVRAGWAVGRELAVGASRRRRHVAVAEVVGRRGADPLVITLDFDEPVIYCVPGRRPRVIVSSAAAATLPPEELSAVLAHERAHLRARHDLVLAIAHGLVRAFPVPLFRTAADEVVRLVELAADDAAARHHDRRNLANALVTVATARVPRDALAAGGATALARVGRLAQPGRPLRRPARWALMAALLTVALSPLVVGGAPLAAVAGTDQCLVPRGGTVAAG